MKASRTALLVVSLLAALPGLAAVAIAQPGPEHKRLDAVVGKWRVEMETRASASAPAAKASGTEECEWFANLHVVCRGEATGAAGLYKSMRTISYLPALKQYGQYSIDSLGYATFMLGSVSGDTWTFSTEVAGVKMRSVSKISRDNYTMSTEYMGADGKWVPTASTKSTRTK